jgi:hypothetical protein
MTEAFIKFPKALMAATHYISLTTSEEVQFTPSNKTIWLTIKDRYDFFTSLGKEWFDNHEDIAALSGSTISTVKRFLAELSKHGYLKTFPKKIGGCATSNRYVVTKDLVLPSTGKARATAASPAVQPRPNPMLVYSAPDEDDAPVWDWDIRASG